jgi:hypothetical protein
MKSLLVILVGSIGVKGISVLIISGVIASPHADRLQLFETLFKIAGQGSTRRRFPTFFLSPSDLSPGR